MSKIADAEANATSLDGLVNDNGLIPTLRNGPKPSYQYLVDGWDAQIQSSIFDLNKSRGFRVVGSFTDGFTYELFNDVGIDTDGNSWAYVGAGAPNKVVPAGTNPVGNSDYRQVTYSDKNDIPTISALEASLLQEGEIVEVTYVELSKRVSAGKFEIISPAEASSRGLAIGYTITNGVFDGQAFEIANGNIAVVADDVFGLSQALLDESGIIPSGLPDSVGDSNLLNSIKNLTKSADKVLLEDGRTAQEHIDYSVKYFISESEAVSFGFTNDNEQQRIRIQNLNTYTDYEVVSANNFGDDIDLGSGMYARRIKSYDEIMNEKGAKFLNYMAAAGAGSQGQPLYVIGDSIPEGTDSTNFAEFGYAALLRKSINKAYNNRNYGFANFNFRVPQAVNQPHVVTRSGFDVITGSEGDSFNSDYFGGIVIESDAAGQWVEFTYTGKDFLIVYGENALGGSVDVTLDGTPFSTIDTSVVPTQRYTGSSTNGRFSDPLTPSKWGLHTVRLTTTSSAPVRLCGVVYCESFSSKINSPTVFNVGRSSLALSNVPDELLEAYCNSGTILLSMGVNDDLGSLPIEVFRSKVELVLNKVNSLNGNAIVNDFIFNKSTTNNYKFALRELASKYGFKYFDFYELWFGESSANIFSNLLDDDNVHPTDYGHLNIAKNICNYINLPLNTEVKPKKILKQFAAGVINLAGYEPVSTYVDGDITYVSGVAKNDSGAVIPQNTKLVNIGGQTPLKPQIIPIQTLSGMKWVEVRSDGWIYTGFGVSIDTGDWFSLNISFVNTSA